MAPLTKSAVYTDYDITAPPPHPGLEWTRFVCISDTHSRTYPVPMGDILLHGGDLSSWGYTSQLLITIEWLKTLDHPHKIIVAGNHDLCLDRKWAHDLELLRDWDVYSHPAVEGLEETVDFHAAFRRVFAAEGLTYLENQSYSFTTPAGKTWNVWGSPASPLYGGNAFQYATKEEARGIYTLIPDDTDILITHTPPHLVLDKTRNNKRAGCKVLAQWLEEMDERQKLNDSLDSMMLSRMNLDTTPREWEGSSGVRLHVFGHIHEARGVHVDRPETRTERVSVNAAMSSQHLGKPIIVDLLNNA